MCGISAYSSGIKEPTSIENWHNMIRSFLGCALEKNSCMFIELTKGCSNASCCFECEAKKEKPQIVISPYDLVKTEKVFVRLFEEVHNKFLFGLGDVSTYPFQELKDFPLKDFSVNVCPTIAGEEKLKFLIEKRVRSMICNVYSDIDAKIANRIDVSGGVKAQIQVSKDTDWKSLFNLVRTAVIFKGTFQDANNHIRVEHFIEDFVCAYGFKLIWLTMSNKTKSTKIVLEKIEDNKDYVIFSFRRCFREDSCKFVLKIETHFPLENLPTVEFKTFLESEPPCHLCEGKDTWVAWREAK